VSAAPPGPIVLPDSFGRGQLRLRPPTQDDVARLAEICRDPAIGHFTTVPVPYDEVAAEDFVAFARARRREGVGAHLLVVDPDAGHDGSSQDDAAGVVGAVGLDLNHADRAGRIGYWVAPAARGRGVATRAVRRVCAWALDPQGLGLQRLELDTAATNAASNAVARRLGFTHEGTRRSAMLLSATDGFDEERVDANDWGLLPGELT
jgi:RimJ/RimL family protein N-acetyltransferase